MWYTPRFSQRFVRGWRHTAQWIYPLCHRGNELLLFPVRMKLHVDTVTVNLFYPCPMRAHYLPVVASRWGSLLQKEFQLTFVEALRFVDVYVYSEMLNWLQCGGGKTNNDIKTMGRYSFLKVIKMRSTNSSKVIYNSFRQARSSQID